MNAEQINDYNTEANMKDKWDLEERKGFRKIGEYYIYKSTNFGTKQKKKISLLFYIDNQIRILQNLCGEYSYHVNEPYVKSQLLLLANTPHRVQEIPPRSGFLGINKPKEIYDCAGDGLVFPQKRVDRKCRAKYRLVMLQLNRTTPKDLKELLIHELSHGGCNHLIYMNDENHEEDFKLCEKNLEYIVNNHNIFSELSRFLS